MPTYCLTQSQTPDCISGRKRTTRRTRVTVGRVRRRERVNPHLHTRRPSQQGGNSPRILPNIYIEEYLAQLLNQKSSLRYSNFSSVLLQIQFLFRSLFLSVVALSNVSERRKKLNQYNQFSINWFTQINTNYFTKIYSYIFNMQKIRVVLVFFFFFWKKELARLCYKK